MSSSTALLPNGSNKKNDHPIFLRACHSPWINISQKCLVYLRGALAAYFLISSLVILHYELEILKNGWLVIYNLSNIVYGLQTLYAWVAFIWTFMHLYYPHNNDNNSSSLSGYMRRFLSPSRKNTNTNGKYLFSVFHWVILAFPHVVTFIHWAVIVPRNKTEIPGDTIFDDKLTTYFIFSKHGLNSVVALSELFILSSIKRCDPVWNHVTAIAVLLLAYVGWAAVGKFYVGKYTYFFLDYEKLGWEYYWTSVAAFIVLGELFFAFVYSLTGVRESMTKKQSDDRGAGYQRLPQ
ncbi:e9a439e8-1922-4531-bfe6-c9bfcc2e65f3 [Sclerotinia trifoliorum]|uniref:E9a439e8-1922-4531-bfe6-c9bfcc2e65f3 n=1 Tax=Sclerotinia trifoliorum TaxID=28548 RepID=A0A8H2ZPZ4_9HELO|nr:e9a439e8-1922-4531-bfe6-c9bfcc2e65f3 [Sclerotinia trifoliorum]